MQSAQIQYVRFKKSLLIGLTYIIVFIGVVLFDAEPFVFQFAIQKFKDQDI